MDLSSFKKIANSLSGMIDDNEKIPLSVFSLKLKNASEGHPEDRTLGMMSDVVSRMGNKLFITRAEVKELYRRLYSNNNKFASIFSDELGTVETPKASQKYNRSNNDENGDVFKFAMDNMIDPVFANALNQAFGNTNSKAYSETAAKEASKLCQEKLNSFGFNVKISSSNGEGNFIVCRASFQTPKGEVSVFIPTTAGAYPRVFVGNSGAEDLSKNNLASYIVANAGQKLNISDKTVLATIKNAGKEEVSNVDIALIKLNASKQSPAYLETNQVIMQKVASAEENLVVNVPKYQHPEIETFAKAFSTPGGIANHKFGRDKVQKGLEVVANALKVFGMKNVQVNVLDVGEDNVVYAAKTNQVAIKIPMKVANMIPTIFICNGQIMDFSKENLCSLAKTDNKDATAEVFASAFNGLKASQLVEMVKNAANKKEFGKVEEILVVLKAQDEKAYKVAFNLFQKSLSGEVEKVAAGCNLIVKSSASNQNLCGHLNLPLSKVCQDKHGTCQPLYRQNMNDSNEGAAYLQNHKIFL